MPLFERHLCCTISASMDGLRKLIALAILLATFVGAYFYFNYLGINTSLLLSIVALTMPLWLPVTTFFLFYDKWINYVRYFFDQKAKRTTIEVLLPQEILKSPLAMELVINQLFQTAGIDNHVQSWWDGKHPPTFRLELISTEGEVRFCINTQAKFKNMIEAQLYAQYPGIEVKELPVDYSFEIPKNMDGYGSFWFHFKLSKPDAYPIRTYIDYKLDTNPDEEEKIDPISVALETLGSLGPGQHMWVQIMIKANKSYDFKSGSLKPQADWKDDVKSEIKKIIEGAKKRGAATAEDERGGSSQLLDSERDAIKAMDRSLSKYAFNTYIRAGYIAKFDNFDGTKIGGMASIFRAYDDVARNKIAPIWRTETDWPWWQDRGGRKTDTWKKEELEDYKKRSYNERHQKDTGMILTTEELATVFHFPGSVVLSPNVRRIGSQRGEAPSNLPI